MRIGIDARFLTHPQPGGFKTYTTNLIEAFAEIDKRNEYILYLDREPNGQTFLPHSPNISTCVLPGTVPGVGMVWREQVLLPRQAKHDKLDLLHSPCLTAPLLLPCPLVVTIHDMIWNIPQPQHMFNSMSAKRKLMGEYYRRIPARAAQQAKAVITVSQDAKDSITSQLGIPSEQITVTYEAASQVFRQIDNREQLSIASHKYNIYSNFILSLGSADPRKNLRSLVLAYAKLPADLQEQYQLVIVWTHTFLSSEMGQLVDSLGLQDRVKFVQDVGNEDLACLYNLASLFAFPSLYEGFGLPPLEAMACGTPVVAANNSSIPEIVGDAAILFDAENVTSIADAICHILMDQDLQVILIDNGLEQASSFSWAKCARNSLDVYSKVLAKE